MEKAQRVGRRDDLPDDYISMAEKAYAYYMWLAGPDERRTPHFNDTGGASAVHWYERALAYFPECDDFRWMAAGGEQGTAPTHTSHLFDWAGHAVMRSSWDPDANYLCLDPGPLGISHVHRDKLNVVCHAWGRRILFDNGGANMKRASGGTIRETGPLYRCRYPSTTGQTDTHL